MVLAPLRAPIREVGEAAGGRLGVAEPSGDADSPQRGPGNGRRRKAILHRPYAQALAETKREAGLPLLADVFERTRLRVNDRPRERKYRGTLRGCRRRSCSSSAAPTLRRPSFPPSRRNPPRVAADPRSRRAAGLSRGVGPRYAAGLSPISSQPIRMTPWPRGARHRRRPARGHHLAPDPRG